MSITDFFRTSNGQYRKYTKTDAGIWKQQVHGTPLLEQYGILTGQTVGAVTITLTTDGMPSNGASSVESANEIFLPNHTILSVDLDIVGWKEENDKVLVMKRRVMMSRSSGSIGNSRIGSVQTIGTDGSVGSPTFAFNNVIYDSTYMRITVAGAAAETVNWRCNYKVNRWAI